VEPAGMVGRLFTASRPGPAVPRPRYSDTPRGAIRGDAGWPCYKLSYPTPAW